MLFFCNFLIFDVPQYSNRLDYIKDIRPAIYFNNQKIVAYHLQGTEGNSNHGLQPGKITHWLHTFFIHHRTLETTNIALFVPALSAAGTEAEH